MCLTVTAFAFFLNLLPADIVSAEPGRITVQANVSDVLWEERPEAWCTHGPQIDRAARFGE